MEKHKTAQQLESEDMNTQECGFRRKNASFHCDHLGHSNGEHH